MFSAESVILTVLRRELPSTSARMIFARSAQLNLFVTELGA